jgi:hypothetical protein
VTDEQINKLIATNQQLLLIVGYASGLIMGLEAYIDKEKLEWLDEAISNVVYLDKPIPKLP